MKFNTTNLIAGYTLSDKLINMDNVLFKWTQSDEFKDTMIRLNKITTTFLPKN